MRLPGFTSNNKRYEVPSPQHLNYIQNVSCVLKFKFNLTAYVTQQSYPKNTRTELEWKRNCSFDSGQCCGHCEHCGFMFVVLVLLLTKVPENTTWLLVIPCKNVQIGSVSGCSLMNLHFPSTLNPNQPTHGLSQKFYPHVHSLTLPSYSQANSEHHLISALKYFSLRFL